MGDTSIEWAQKVWNPIAGCSIVSPGCSACYAMKMAHRIEGMNKALGRENHYAGLTKKTKAGAVWTGKLATAPDNIFLAPLRWKKPARVFANSMADLFHENVADATIDRAFAVMALCPHLTFMVLTKRSARMWEYFEVERRPYLVDQQCDLIVSHHMDRDKGANYERPWPLSNVWLGCSVEDQQRADERIPDLLATPAAVRFLSCEPLLGPLELDHYLRAGSHRHVGPIGKPPISLAIIGGESGPRSRPFMLSWAESIITQCREAGVAAFVKQLGAEAYDDRSYIDCSPRFETKDRKGASMEEWPHDLRVREMPK